VGSFGVVALWYVAPVVVGVVALRELRLGGAAATRSVRVHFAALPSADRASATKRTL